MKITILALLAASLHVAPTGNDTNPGTLERPFATIHRALDEKPPGTILLRGGTYSLDQPLVLGPEHSDLTIAAFRDEQPVINGGRRITGWTSAGNNLWTATVATNWNFHELWVNGQRRQRAPYPNTGYFKIAGLPDVTATTDRKVGQKRFRFAPGDIQPWHNLDDVDVIALHLWVSVRLAVASVDTQSNIVNFVAPSRRKLVDGKEPAQYYVENALELLDAPGEWYLDRHTGTLSYRPMRGEDMARAEVIAPVLEQLVRLENTERVTFRGLAFSHAEWWLPRNNSGDEQASAKVPGAIIGTGARQCVFDACQLSHLGSYALELSRGCQSNRISQCEIFDLGAGGIKLGETGIRTNVADQVHHNEVVGCHIHDGGKIFHQAIGVWIGQSASNRVAQNRIHDFWYSGISVGWTWGYGPSLAGGNLIVSNTVHHIGKLSNGEGPILSDMGGIYTLGKQPGTVIRNNVFHDIAALRYGGWGIYFDEGSSGIVAENNLVYRTTHGGFHQHYGETNVVRNNIFAFGRDQQLQRTRVEPHRSFTFERNIIYWDKGTLLAGNWTGDRYRMVSNLYWRADGKPVTVPQDQHPLKADPLFRDPKHGDFTLRRNSPAAQLGFEVGND